MRAIYIPAGRAGGTECVAKTCVYVKIVSKLSLCKRTVSVNILLICCFIFGLKQENVLFPLHQKIMLYFDFLICNCKTALLRLMSVQIGQ